MLTRFQMIGIGLAGALVWAVIGAVHSPETIHAKGQYDPAAQNLLSSAEIAALEAAQDRATQISIAGMKNREAASLSRDQAATKTLETRRLLQYTVGPRWSSVLRTNWPTYMELRAQAARSPNHETPCTICEGRQFLDFCVVCPEHKGECVTCRGSKHVSSDSICPNCLGRGKCYLCFGLGRMPCPFCYSGLVDDRRPVPSSSLPTYSQ
jgi:hypothetical protein